MNSISQDKRAAIERVRTSLAMRDADYGTIPSSEDVADLLSAYDALTAPPADMEGAAHKIMTPEEYSALKIEGWHQVCKDFDGFGAVAIRYGAVSALQRGVPDGWQLVPKEPTETMLRAARDKAFWAPVNYAGHYRAMLAAAPVVADDRSAK